MNILVDGSVWEFAFQAVVSMVLGFIIGYERQVKGKPAGIKTHSLICLGSMVFTYLSIYMSPFGDPTRIAAQVVTGIGFLGAGTIFMAKTKVRGLTSAAAVWISSAVGMLVGAGFTVPAVITVVLVLMMYGITKPRRALTFKSYALSIEVVDWDSLSRLSKLIEAFQLEVHDKTLERNPDLVLSISYSAPTLAQHLFLRKLFALKGLGRILKI